MSVLGAPRHPIQTTLPPWSRFRTDPNGRRYIRVDSRGGPQGCITHSELFPQGETVSIMCSAMVRSSMLFGNELYEGIGVAVQAYVRDASAPSGLRRLPWQRRPDLQGDATLWVGKQFSDWTPVDFVVQMPENISPDFIRVSWVTKGYSGQTDITDFVVRDFYSRTFETRVAPTSGPNEYDFNKQLGRELLEAGDGSKRHVDIWAHYFATHVTRVKSGQPIDVHISADIDRATWVNNNVNRVPLHGYAGLKCLRREDGGTDWIFAHFDRGDDPTVVSGVTSVNVRRPAQNAYTQIEPVIFVIPTLLSGQSIIQTNFDHRGISMKITIDDSVESGTG